MSQVHLSRIGVLGPVVRLVEERGRNANQLLSAIGLPRSALEDPDELIPQRDMFLFLETAARKLCDPVFGASLGKLASLDDLGDYGLALAGEPSLRGAIDFANTNAGKLVKQGIELQLRDVGAQAIWSYRSLEKAQIGKCHDGLLSIGRMLAVVKNFATSDWTPAAVIVPDELKISDDLLQEAFGCNVVHHGETYGLLLDNDLLCRLTAGARVKTSKQRETYRKMIVPLPDDLASVTWRMCLLQLHCGSPRIEDVAWRMGVLPRTLQRRLRELGLTFRDIRLAATMTRADALLVNSSLSISAISRNLGYSDASHFARAYKAWAGRGPSQTRCLSVDAEHTVLPRSVFARAS